MFKLILIVLILVSGINAFGQDGLPVGKVYRKPQAVMNYREAYKLANESNDPWLILVSASWCGPCIELKNTTIPNMQKSGKLDKVIVTHIDIDEEPDLSKQLRSNSSVPELIFFRKRNNRWLKRVLIGKQSEESIENLIRE